MKHSLLEITKQFIEKEALFTVKDKLLLAISGGIDSVCLAYVLQELDYTFDLVHVNFQLRGAASDEDQALVERLAKKLGVRLRLQSSNSEEIAAMSKQALQETARQIRYDYFAKLVKEENYDYVLTAHHLEDNLETTLLNLLRGTGLNGLTGIPAKRDHYRRPFLEASRNEIERYAAANHLLWREDASNASDAYRRNYLRHHVLPALKKVDANWDQQLRSTYENLRRDRELFNYANEAIFEQLLDEDQNIIRAKLPKDSLVAEQLLNHQLSPYGFSGDQFRQMITAKSGSTISSPTGVYQVTIRPTRLILEKNTDSEDEAHRLLKGKEETLLITASTATLKFSKNKALELTEIDQPEELTPKGPTVVYFSKTAAPLPWHLRRPRPGDHFQPFGMQGKSKKLQDFFTDIKLPRSAREEQWLLCDSRDTILWVVGLRMSETGRVKATDKQVIKVALVNNHKAINI